MKRRTATVLLMAAIAGVGLSAAQAEHPTASKKAPKKQTVCPVMGGKINKAQYADVKGKRIYVCCPGCIGKIKADPGKYIKKMEAEGIVLNKTPKKAAASKEHDHAPIKGYAEHEK
ncbi:MAG: hypothetical protein KAU94_00270 [Verrucomicrobia bacterium]|nr:hypothetical protein [Verrucomicrobiota bacterium]